MNTNQKVKFGNGRSLGLAFQSSVINPLDGFSVYEKLGMDKELIRKEDSWIDH